MPLSNAAIKSRASAWSLPIHVASISLILLAMLANVGWGQAVSFDVPAFVVAEPVNPAVVDAPVAGGELMRLRIPWSALVSPGFAGGIEEYLVDIRSPGLTMRVIDLWPRTEVYSNVEGSIAVESATKSDNEFAFAVSGAYEPFGRGNASGKFQESTSSQQRYQRKPPMQILTSSGTSHRGYGVFFKFRPGPIPVLEGSREVAILCEVPQGWRGDLLQVSMQAVGKQKQHSASGKQLGVSQHWLSTHREGDAVAAAQVQRFVMRERQLRSMAQQLETVVAARSTPSVWRKLGAALDVVQPRIPENYLSQIVFGPANRQFSDGTEYLPVDLRVAALDYWEQRDHLLQLAASNPLGSQRVAAKVVAN